MSKCGYLFCFLVIFFLIGFYIYSDYQDSKFRSRLNSVSDSYSIYINGSRVDSDDICLDKFNSNDIVIDDDQEKIIITLD